MDHHSSIGSLDILETEDTSLLVLSREIDQHTSDMRNSVLHSIASIRNRIHQQTAEIMDRHREASSATERKMMQQIDNLQDLLEKKERDLARERSLNERLLAMHQRQKRRRATQDLAVEALRAWRNIVREKKQRQRLCDHLVQHRTEKEARAVFAGWRLEALRQKAEAEQEKTANDHRRQIAKLQQEAQSSENRLKLEVLGWREKLAKEEEHRGLLEEKLKAAFMRGVCALNLEAMQVLRHAADADVSVASLLQGMNVTVNSDDATRGPGSSGTADRLLQQQAALNEQLSALQTQQVNTTRPPEPEECPPQPHHYHDPGVRATNSSHQPFVVNVNPRYPRGGAAPAAAPGKRISKR
jgi:hypothetical protein